MSYEGEKYHTTPEGIKSTIEKYGVAIVPSVLDEGEISLMRNGMWDYLEHVTQKFEKPISREDSKTWVEYLKLYPKHSMPFSNMGLVNHSLYGIFVKMKKVVDIFSKIWERPKKNF